MNRALYTILIVAASVGITLALMMACSKKCVCDDTTQNTIEMETTDVDDSGMENSQNAGSNASSKRGTSGQADKTKGENTSQDEPLRKYGDAETGGNVYTIGGVQPAKGKSGAVTNTSGSGTTNGGGTSSVTPANQKTGNSGDKEN